MLRDSAIESNHDRFTLIQGGGLLAGIGLVGVLASSVLGGGGSATESPGAQSLARHSAAIASQLSAQRSAASPGQAVAPAAAAAPAPLASYRSSSPGTAASNGAPAAVRSSQAQPMHTGSPVLVAPASPAVVSAATGAARSYVSPTPAAGARSVTPSAPTVVMPPATGSTSTLPRAAAVRSSLAQDATQTPTTTTPTDPGTTQTSSSTQTSTSNAASPFAGLAGNSGLYDQSGRLVTLTSDISQMGPLTGTLSGGDTYELVNGVWMFNPNSQGAIDMYGSAQAASTATGVPLTNWWGSGPPPPGTAANGATDFGGSSSATGTGTGSVAGTGTGS